MKKISPSISQTNTKGKTKKVKNLKKNYYSKIFKLIKVSIQSKTVKALLMTSIGFAMGAWTPQITAYSFTYTNNQRNQNKFLPVIHKKLIFKNTFTTPFAPGALTPQIGEKKDLRCSSLRTV